MPRLSLACFSKWDIVASVVLARPPVVAPPMVEVEQRFQRLQRQEEQENSLLNDYELKSKQDQKLLERREALAREGKELSELDEQIAVTNAVREDEWKRKSQELEKKYGFSKVQDEENEKNLQRLLDRKLVLIVRQKFGQKGYASPWILPQIKHRAGETLRQTAERCIGEVSKGDVNLSIAGNAPFAVHTQKYPKPIREKTDATGAKIFFYHANLAQNNSSFVVNEDDVSDYRWVTPEEFWKTVTSQQYKLSVRTALFE